MNPSGSKAAGLAIAALLTNHVFAMGLGEASGRAVLGQPLHLEIPILGGDGSAALKSCFRLRAPRAEVGNDFAARNARADVVGAKLIVTTATAVTEPVIGFAVEAICAGLSRDYVMLVGLPATPPPTPAVDARRATTPTGETPPPVQTFSGKTTAPDDALRIAAPLTLEALARQKYPLQPKAREKFMRMMIDANPGLVSIDTSIAAGTELRVPAGLPQRRVGPYQGESKAAPRQQQALPRETAAAAVATPTAQPSPAPKAGKDRLVLGRAPESNEAKLLAEAERLANILVDQTKAQEEVAASLGKMEADYAELRKQFIEMQTRLARIEAERAAEKQAAENSKAAQLVELVVAVLGGGAVGGIGLHLFQRRRLQKKENDDDAGFEEEDFAAPPAPQSVRLGGKPAVPPWIAGKTSANEASVPESEASPAAMIAAITEVSIEEAEMPSRANAEDSSSPTSGEDPPVVDESGRPAAETAEAPALPEVRIETPEPVAVLEPLDFSPVAVENEVTEPPRPPAKTEGTAQETLTLDFPEIRIPGADPEKDALDFRKE